MYKNYILTENEIVRFPVKVEWEWIGEGKGGDYNDEDPSDVKLLRFNVYVWSYRGEGNWEDVEDASYCTQFPVNASEDARKYGLIHIMDAVWKPIITGKPIKRICEKLSWIDPASVAQSLWEKFDTPIDIDGNIEEEFLHFEVGTPREDIWHWFEKTFDISVHVKEEP